MINLTFFMLIVYTHLYTYTCRLELLTEVKESLHNMINCSWNKKKLKQLDNSILPSMYIYKLHD